MSVDILVVATPIWLAEHSSVCDTFIERLYSASAKLKRARPYIYYGRVAGCRFDYLNPKHR